MKFMMHQLFNFMSVTLKTIDTKKEKALGEETAQNATRILWSERENRKEGA